VSSVIGVFIIPEEYTLRARPCLSVTFFVWSRQPTCLGVIVA